MTPTTSKHAHVCSNKTTELLDPEDKNTMIFQNVRILPCDTASHPSTGSTAVNFKSHELCY